MIKPGDLIQLANGIAQSTLWKDNTPGGPYAGWARDDVPGLCLARIDNQALVLFGQALGWSDALDFERVPQ